MASLDLAHTSSFKGGSETFLRNVFENILKTYLRKNPTTKRIWELIQSLDNEKICYDHFTFMTLKVDSYGIDSLSSFFMNYGYKIGNGPLPRLVMGEILVDELSPESQAIIRKYLKPEGVSTDGLLLQVSSISEKLPVEFADGVTKLVPASYIEFTDRLVLPQFKELPYDQIKEFHRREDFALNNADNILESSRFTSNV
ncbi:unnamed protein product [Arabidopsis lyrata]|nr:unnamed protein product [Arabidopsis lyrata]